MLCLVAQSCPTLCDPMDYSPPGSSVHGDSPGKNTGVGCHALLREIFWTQGSNPGLLHCKQILYCLSHQETQESNQGLLHCRKILYQLSYPGSSMLLWSPLYSFLWVEGWVHLSTSHLSIYSHMLSLLLEMTYLCPLRSLASSSQATFPSTTPSGHHSPCFCTWACLSLSPHCLWKSVSCFLCLRVTVLPSVTQIGMFLFSLKADSNYWIVAKWEDFK